MTNLNAWDRSHSWRCHIETPVGHEDYVYRKYAHWAQDSQSLCGFESQESNSGTWREEPYHHFRWCRLRAGHQVGKHGGFVSIFWLHWATRRYWCFIASLRVCDRLPVVYAHYNNKQVRLAQLDLEFTCRKESMTGSCKHSRRLLSHWQRQLAVLLTLESNTVRKSPARSWM